MFKCPSLKIIILIILPSFLFGCAQMAVGGISKTVMVVKEERTIGTFVDDSLISAKLKNNYFNTNENIFFNVDVEVNEGRVLLTGTVSGSDVRIEATRTAWSIDGVKTVINELQISDNDSIFDYADDLIITTKVQAKLLLALDINNLNYNIDTVNRVVYVIGIAQNKKELESVLKIIRGVFGVEEVINYVRIKENNLTNAN